MGGGWIFFGIAKNALFATCLATFLGLQWLHKVDLGSTFCKDYTQVILAGTLTGVQRWHSMQSFGGPFHSKITWAGTGLREGCNRREFFLLFIDWNGVHIAEVLDVRNWIPFGRDYKNWKYKDLKLKWCRQWIWLWGKTSQQNSSSRINLIGC